MKKVYNLEARLTKADLGLSCLYMALGIFSCTVSYTSTIPDKLLQINLYYLSVTIAHLIV